MYPLVLSRIKNWNTTKFGLKLQISKEWDKYADELISKDYKNLTVIFQNMLTKCWINLQSLNDLTSTVPRALPLNKE